MKTEQRGSEVLLSIVNSVSGLASTPGHGMALRNVRERLHLMHDVAARFEARRQGDEFHVNRHSPLKAQGKCSITTRAC